MMPLTRLLAAMFLLMSVLLFVQPSVAENWNERDKLAAIVEELARLESLIDEASVHAEEFPEPTQEIVRTLRQQIAIRGVLLDDEADNRR